MAAPTPYPYPTAFEFPDVMAYSAGVSDLYGPGLLLFIMGIVFLALNGFPAEQRFAASTWAGFLLSVILVMVGAMNWEVVVLLALLVGVSYFLQKD